MIKKSKDASQTIEEKAENEERLKKKKAVHEELKAKKNVEVQEVRAALYSKLEIIGNLVHDSVPVSDDEVCGFFSFIVTYHERIIKTSLLIKDCFVGK